MGGFDLMGRVATMGLRTRVLISRLVFGRTRHQNAHHELTRGSVGLSVASRSVLCWTSRVQAITRTSYHLVMSVCSVSFLHSKLNTHLPHASLYHSCTISLSNLAFWSTVSAACVYFAVYITVINITLASTLEL